MAEDGINNVFVLSFDRKIDSEVRSLKADIEAGSGRIVVKNIDVVRQAKGADLAKKLQNILKWAKIVLIVCSDNIASVFDKKEVDECPELIKNEKESVKVIKKFLEEDLKKIPNKTVLVAVTNTDYTLPKNLKGMPVIKKAESNSEFIREIVAEIVGR